MSAVEAVVVPVPEPVRVRLVPAGPPRGAAPVLRGPAHRAVPSVHERITVLRAVETTAVETGETSPAPTIDPAQLARSLAGAFVEVVRGVRPVGQLARWLGLGVLHELRERVALGASAPAVAVRPAAVRRITVCQLPSAIEVSAAVDDGVRVRAVAFRLEAHRGSWLVTALEIG
jgi:hypothetical protein